MSDKTETATNQEEKLETARTSNSLFGNGNSSTPNRLFGQFKQNGFGFGGFSQINSTEGSSPTSTSYFTNTLSKISTNFGTGFGSATTSLAASLAPLSTNKELFGCSTKSSNEEKPEDRNNDDADENEDDVESTGEEKEEENQSTASLLEKAAEYEAKRASTHPAAYIQGDTSTGEEHEVTKFQIIGKLYMYNAEQRQYVERGYGVLKINESHDPSDRNKLQARLIMRLDKAFRVILNSPIFPKMTVERASDRSVRFGAQDESQLRIFVIKATSNDCTNLCKELESRIQIIERQQETASSNSPSPNKNPADLSPTDPVVHRIRKRSHSKSDSEQNDQTNDLSKKSKLIEGYRDENKDASDDDSGDSIQGGEQETAD